MSEFGTPKTPLARRAEPTVKLDQPICLRCSKRVGDGGETCNKPPLAKCDYCRRLKKECGDVPPSFRKEVNKILRMNRRLADGEELEGEDGDVLAQAKRRYVKDVEAFGRKAVKHGLTKKPKGDEIQLLQVKALERVASALEGILDCLRAKDGHAPLGDDDAPTDPGSGGDDDDEDDDGGDGGDGGEGGGGEGAAENEEEGDAGAGGGGGGGVLDWGEGEGEGEEERGGEGEAPPGLFDVAGLTTGKRRHSEVSESGASGSESPSSAKKRRRAEKKRARKAKKKALALGAALVSAGPVV